MLASAPIFLCFLLNMIIKKRADNVRPYGYRNNLLVVSTGKSSVGAAICRPKVIET